MKELITEILLRFIKPAIATVLAVVVYGVAVAAGLEANVGGFLVCWLVGAGLVLLMESGPI